MAVLLTACTPRPVPEPMTFREIQREDDVYRVTGRWQGDAPTDLERRMLLRCAEVAKADGAVAFFIVNADVDISNTTYLRKDSPVIPVFRVPEERAGDGGRSATLTIKLFRKGKEPDGYRLYDVEAILRQERPVTSLRFGISIGTAVGVPLGTRR